MLCRNVRKLHSVHELFWNSDGCERQLGILCCKTASVQADLVAPNTLVHTLDTLHLVDELSLRVVGPLCPNMLGCNIVYGQHHYKNADHIAHTLSDQALKSSHIHL